MATSKSPLIPIDSSRSIDARAPAASQPSRRSRSFLNQGRASSALSGAGGGVRLAYQVEGKGLGDGDEPDGGGIPAGRPGCGGDAPADCGEPLCDRHQDTTRILDGKRAAGVSSEVGFAVEIAFHNT